MNFSDVIFGFPYAFWLIFFVIFVGCSFGFLFYSRMFALQNFATPQLISSILKPPSLVYRILYVFSLCLVWIFACLALSDPKGHGIYENQEKFLGSEEKQDASFKIRRKSHEVMLLIDSSASMLTTDTRVGKSRLDYAKDILDNIMGQMKGETTSLYAFTSQVIPLVPSTLDYLYLRLLLEKVEINEGGKTGTDFLQTFRFMNERWSAEPPSKLKTLIIVSDGEDTKLEGLQGKQRMERESEILAAIGDPSSQNLRIFTIGLGSSQGSFIPGISYLGRPVRSALDEQLLKDIAEKGRGGYLNANDETPPNLAQQIIEMISQDHSSLEEKEVNRHVLSEEGDHMIFDLYFQFPLGLCIIFLALALITPERKKIKNNED